MRFSPALAVCLVLGSLALVSTGCAHSPPRLTEPMVGSPLYPPITPYDTGFLDVGQGHSLYYEQSGNPAGLPVVFIHGGPGSGTKPKQRQFFDPAVYRIILFDQAGSGKSRSRDLLTGNDTWSLVRHLEKVRAHLGVAKWLLFGGSWGSTLALAYAEAHPDRTAGIITWGVFLGRPAEIDWTYKRGYVSMIHPEAFARFESFIAQRERHDLLAAYARRFKSKSARPEDLATRREAVRRWTEYEEALSSLEPQPPENPTDAELDGTLLSRAIVESHYMLKHAFLSTSHNELLAHVDRLRNVPITVIAARYDLDCPVATAFDLKTAAPWVTIRLITLAGHASLGHPAVTAALVEEAALFSHSYKP